jgi:alkylation response protein AidB-like acyl-CoA dehydrogenase
MHTLLHWGTPAQKEKYLRPLCEGVIRSCFAMTKPEAPKPPPADAPKPAAPPPADKPKPAPKKPASDDPYG